MQRKKLVVVLQNVVICQSHYLLTCHSLLLFGVFSCCLWTERELTEGHAWLLPFMCLCGSTRRYRSMYGPNRHCSLTDSKFMMRAHIYSRFCAACILEPWLLSTLHILFLTMLPCQIGGNANSFTISCY